MYTPGAQAQNHSVGISGDLVCLLLWSLPGDTDVHLPLKTTLNFSLIFQLISTIAALV